MHGRHRAVQRVGVAGLEINGASEEADRGGEVFFECEDVGQDDMAPSVIGSEAQGINEVVFGGGEIAEFKVGHGEIAMRIGHGRICSESLCKKIDGCVKVARSGFAGTLISEAHGFFQLLWVRLPVCDAGHPLGNSDTQFARQKRELAQDFLAEIGMARRVLQILLREKSEIGQFDDESLHSQEITKGDERSEGKG